MQQEKFSDAFVKNSAYYKNDWTEKFCLAIGLNMFFVEEFCKSHKKAPSNQIVQKQHGLDPFSSVENTGRTTLSRKNSIQ